LIDCDFETETGHDFISRSVYRPLLRPSKGKAIGAAAKRMNEYRKSPGDLTGHNWRIDANPQGNVDLSPFATNSWKSFVAEAILAPAGVSGSFYLPGSDLQRENPLFTNHLLSEYRIPTFGQGRRVEEWKPRPEAGEENHWWDGGVGCAVAASVIGLKWSAAVSLGETKNQTAKEKALSPTEEYERKRREFEARRERR